MVLTNAMSVNRTFVRQEERLTSKASHRSNTHTFTSRPRVEDLSWHDPWDVRISNKPMPIESFGCKLTRQWSTSSGEREVVDPSNDNETPTCCVIVCSSRRELRQQNSGNNESDTISKIASYQSPTSSGVIDKKDTQCLGYDSDNGRYTLVFQTITSGNPDLGKDIRREVSISKGKHRSQA